MAHDAYGHLPAWGDREIARFKFRSGLFQRRGMTEGDAETLADRLYERDFEKDPRRSCVECESRQQSRTCFKKLSVTVEPFQLINCAGFAWQTP